MNIGEYLKKLNENIISVKHALITVMAEVRD